jgi:hypothetical protein
MTPGGAGEAIVVPLAINERGQANSFLAHGKICGFVSKKKKTMNNLGERINSIRSANSQLFNLPIQRR